MSQLISCVFVLLVGYNAYRMAKRRGQWSWPQFFVVVAFLVIVPILIVRTLMHDPWLQDKPVAFTLIAAGLIIFFVCVLALVLKKYWPLPNKPSS